MRVADLFLIQEMKQGTASNGSPFVSVTLADRTGSIECKRWDCTLEGLAPFKAGMLAHADLEVKDYKGKTSGALWNIVETTFADMRDFIKASEHDPEEMWTSFKAYLEGFEHHHFLAIAADLFDETSTAAFRISPAATSMHHGFRHGLLEHTLQMLQIADALLKMPSFSELNRDLCMFGIMFHDFGKIYEYSTDPGYKKRLEGVLVGHIPMVAARILESCNAAGVPAMVRDHMMHVVLAHHRMLQWGSPMKFACPEASFVHFIDNLHGDVHGILQKRATATEDTIKYGYGDDVCTILKKPFSEWLKEGDENGF